MHTFLPVLPRNKIRFSTFQNLYYFNSFNVVVTCNENYFNYFVVLGLVGVIGGDDDDGDGSYHLGGSFNM